MDFQSLENSIQPMDSAAAKAAQARWDNVAKPVGSLGQLEHIVCSLAGIQRTAGVNIDRRAVVVLCADNGVVAQGVASTPQEITAVMTGFIAQGRSTVGIMAKEAHADVIAVDVGMCRRVDVPNLLDRHVADGTADMTQGPAMTREQAEQAVQTGIDLIRECKKHGYQILCTGEMGIGNTTTTSAVASVLLGRPASEMTGPGAGLDPAGLERKLRAIEKAIDVNKPNPNDALDVLSKVGGFDIAAMAGVFIGGAIYNIPVVVDGVISATAALVAAKLCPGARKCMIASHVSEEPASRWILDQLKLFPVLRAQMRLGEGTGAVAVLPLIDMALSVYRNLMTFEDIGM
jgi:nicotinate-nucleotide--dimethylbenzimidazole phosphoribosyltransferase